MIRRSTSFAAAFAVAVTGALVGPSVLSSATTGSASHAALSAGSAHGSPPAGKDRPAVLENRVIGTSAGDRKIHAFHLGQTGPTRTKVLLIATMHGDEPAPRAILTSLRDDRPIRGVNLWVIPTYNPDGLVAHTRKNGHGVDLNRNYPYKWADLDGETESGPQAASEPETKAMMKFLRKTQPDRILSFHQPLHGVDTDTKNLAFARRVARKLELPKKVFDCGGVCHGTMTGWYNHKFDGAALTVEYGAKPPRRRMRVVAPKQVLRIFGAHRIAPDPA